VQRLLGNINWIRNVCGIDNQILAPLFQLLRGDSDLTAPRQMTTEASNALEQINRLISQKQCHRIAENCEIHLYVCNQELQPIAIIGQWDDTQSDPLIIL
ncbi:PO113 protein, partial [Dromaius novaehollandiae]|nr:PO113 protein [Dromaius novaehollandiae]